MNLRVLLLAASVLASGSAIADAGTGTGTGKCRLLKIVDWPVRMVRGHVVVDGAINGKAVGITLDTGAQRSLILRSAAVRLDLPRQEARGYRMYGVGGQTKVETANVDDFRLGAVSTRDLHLFVAGETDFGPGVDVLLGEDFLRNFEVEFDLAHDAVRLHQAKDCGSVSLAYWTQAVAGEVGIAPVVDARPRIEFTVEVNGAPIAAFLDSGAPTSVLSQGDAAALGVTPETPGVVASGLARGVGAGTIALWSGPFRSFAIGNESIPDVRIRFADYQRDANDTPTGSRIARRNAGATPMILGADFLRAHRLLVAHSQRRMYFTYAGGPVFRVEGAAPALAPPADTPMPSGSDR